MVVKGFLNDQLTKTNNRTLSIWFYAMDTENSDWLGFLGNVEIVTSLHSNMIFLTETKSLIIITITQVGCIIFDLLYQPAIG